MQIFLDTANLEEIKKYADLGIVDGVTTNPSLIAKEGVDLEKRIKEICEVVTGPVSSEVLSTDFEGMIKEAKKYAQWSDKIYVKLPMTQEGIKACKILSDDGIKINMTLVFSVTQAILAAKAGARFVSPFIGRLDDISENGNKLIRDLVQIFKNYNFSTQILAASIRTPEHVAEAALAGASIVTMPAKVLDLLFHHPLTDQGLEKFLKDYQSSISKK